MTLEETQIVIAEECDSVKKLLLAKNKKYGNSALEPAQIFSRSQTTEQIRVRIDDKLNRIKNYKETDIDEDTIEDLIEYLILLKIALRIENNVGEKGV